MKIKNKRLLIVVALIILAVCAIIFKQINTSNSPYDIDNDGVVGKSDLALLNSKYGQECDNCPEDVNGDNKVDSEDFSLIVAHYGKSVKDIKVDQ